MRALDKFMFDVLSNARKSVKWGCIYRIYVKKRYMATQVILFMAMAADLRCEGENCVCGVEFCARCLLPEKSRNYDSPEIDEFLMSIIMSVVVNSSGYHAGL